MKGKRSSRLNRTRLEEYLQLSQHHQSQFLSPRQRKRRIRLPKKKLWRKCKRSLMPLMKVLMSLKRRKKPHRQQRSSTNKGSMSSHIGTPILV